MPDINSKFYPYNKVYEGYYNLQEALNIPRKIMNYLLDMPDGVYVPKDDNSYPRTRFWKYLYYDGEHPETNILPTPSQKMSVLFDPNNPTKPCDEKKGWRLLPQSYIKPAQTEAQTRVYVYMGRGQADNDYQLQQSVVFDVWTHYAEEANTRGYDSYSRSYAIVQALIEAFHGVNIGGVGTFYINRSRHPDCGFRPINDGEINVGYRLVLGLQMNSETANEPMEYNEIPMGNTGLSFG